MPIRFIMQDSFSFRAKSADSVSMWLKGGQDKVTGGSVLWVFSLLNLTTVCANVIITAALTIHVQCFVV